MSGEKELMGHIKKYRNGILCKVRGRIDDLFFDSPVNDFTKEQESYEKALRDVIGEIENLRI